MIVGFTGTKQGMTRKQRAVLEEWLAARSGGVFLHGDCVGADAQAHKIAARCGFAITIYPPEKNKHRAFCRGAFETLPPMEYLVRDRLIAANCDHLVAAPRTMAEEVRSGTWYTVRYARRLRKPVTIIWPNGSVVYDAPRPFVVESLV